MVVEGVSRGVLVVDGLTEVDDSPVEGSSTLVEGV